MGLQMNPPIINKRISIQLSLRRRRHDTSRNWQTIPASRAIRPNPQPPKHGLTSQPPTRTQRKSPDTQPSCQTMSYQEIQCKPTPTIICRRGPSMENGNSARKKDGKFSANWDGPYPIREDAEGGAYRLEQLSGEEIPNTWNVSHLKFYFS